MRGCPSPLPRAQIKAPHPAGCCTPSLGSGGILGGGGHCMLSSPARPWGHRVGGTLGTHSCGLGVPGEGWWGSGRALPAPPTSPADLRPLPALLTRGCCASSRAPAALPCGSVSLGCISPLGSPGGWRVPWVSAPHPEQRVKAETFRRERSHPLLQPGCGLEA